MSSLEEIIDSFIDTHELDNELKEPIVDLVNECISGIFKHIFKDTIPDSSSKTKSQKVLKADKIEDPTSVETRDELHNCTTGVLNEFCKKNNLKVGGNKKVLMDRVWRFLQGEVSEDDKSTRNKPKKEKKTAEKHKCSGCNAKGEQCGVAGTEQAHDMWFCWRHIVDSDEFVKKLADSKPSSQSTAEPDITPAEPVKQKKKKSAKKSPEPVAELVTDDEE